MVSLIWKLKKSPATWKISEFETVDTNMQKWAQSFEIAFGTLEVADHKYKVRLKKLF